MSLSLYVTIILSTIIASSAIFIVYAYFKARFKDGISKMFLITFISIIALTAFSFSHVPYYKEAKSLKELMEEKRLNTGDVITDEVLEKNTTFKAVPYK